MKTKILKLKEIKNKINNCILGFGHFSTVHPGHIRYLQNAKKLGGTLVIALIGDIKGKNNVNKFHFKQEERAEALSLLGIVDIVVLLEKDELKDAIKIKKGINEEFGDVLFSLVNLSRHLDIDPESSLKKSTIKFISRFKEIEKKVDIEKLSLEELDKIWNENKEKYNL